VILSLPIEGKGCSGVGTTIGVAEGEAPGVGEIKVPAISEKGAGLPPAVDSIAGRVGGFALVLCSDEVGLSEDPFVWPHLTDPREALFEVNDAAEQAAWGGTS
jgi:hypothetical protein